MRWDFSVLANDDDEFTNVRTRASRAASRSLSVPVAAA